jgi:hypothetical protein
MRELPALFKFAYVPKDKRLEELKELAQKEEWEYQYQYAGPQYAHPILYNYLLHTFACAQEEKKIEYDTVDEESQTQACFNTGLLTANYEQIFAYFELNMRAGDNSPKWILAAFVKESDRRLTRFKLPDMPRFFSNPADLVYNPDLDIRADYDHIINDNQERFLSCLNLASSAPPTTPTLNPQQAAKKDLQSEDSILGSRLRHQLDSSVQEAKKRARRNFKVAVPQLYPPSIKMGRIQLLLPLYIQTRERPDLALIISRDGQVYIGNTVLTLDMAYNNARLLARPDSEWLKP